jgi:hypothetical protein
MARRMMGDDDHDCPPHCCCCGPGDRCCDCNKTPIFASEVLAFVDYFAGQEDTAEDVRDFVQRAARAVSEGETREQLHAEPLLGGFISWCEEQDAKHA